MTEESGKLYKVQISATAKGDASVNAVLITREDQLAPIFEEMDLARLSRIAQGEDILIPGVENAPKKATQLIAQHWYEQRWADRDQIHKWIATVVAVLSAIVAVIAIFK